MDSDSKKSILKWVVIYIFVGFVAFGVSYYFFLSKERSVIQDEVIFETYHSDKYSFEIQYPKEWYLDVSKEGEIPRVTVHKDVITPENATLLSHHANMTLVTIFPEGLGTEGPIGQSRQIQGPLTEAQEKMVQELYLADDQARGYYINFENPPVSWQVNGYVWGGVKVENMTTQEIPLPSGQEGYPQIKVSGNVDQEDFNTILQILSTFKFTNREVMGWKTYINNEYGFEMQYPTNWNLEENEPDARFNIPSKSCIGFSYRNDDLVSSAIQIAGSGNNGCDVISCPALEQVDQIVTKNNIEIDGVVYSTNVISCIHEKRVEIVIPNRSISSIRYWVNAIDPTQEKFDVSISKIEQILSTFKFTK